MMLLRLTFWIVLLVPLTACGGGPSRYTSLDLALLPCEQGSAPIFFRAVEFDAAGQPVFQHQVEELRDRLHSGPPVTDLVFFVHGWNKNPSSAELDYQNFLCRLHARLRTIIGDQKRADGLLVVGVFWPSTITNEGHDPLLVKPVSYYQIRARADSIAKTGLTSLLKSLTPVLAERRGGLPVRLQLVGHSFGGRMLIRALEELQSSSVLVPLLQAAGTVNVVLLNAAVPPVRFEWLSEAIVRAKQQNVPGRFTKETDSYLFNVHSFQDTANRVLFPVASLFSDDPATCAAGACGVPSFATLCVDTSGKIRPRGKLAQPETTAGIRLNAWNVDATRIVFDHTDIYKGRIATLVADLLYDKGGESFRGVADSARQDPAARCAFLNDEQPGVQPSR